MKVLMSRKRTFHTSEFRRELRNDEAIEEDLRFELALNEIVQGQVVEIKSRNGVATLVGTVDTWAERKEARRVANRTPGVWMVDNRIQVNGWDSPWETWYFLGPNDYNSRYGVWDDRYRQAILRERRQRFPARSANPGVNPNNAAGRAQPRPAVRVGRPQPELPTRNSEDLTK